MNHRDALASLEGVTDWRKSSYSDQENACAILAFTTAEWAAFTAGARDNEFDL